VPLTEAFCALRQAVMETYTALAADIPLVIAIAQAILQLLGQLAKHFKERTALMFDSMGGSFLNR